MPWLAFFGSDVATAVVLALVAFIVGRRLCLAVPFECTAERVGICTAVGLGAVALAVLLIGVAGLLTRPVVLGAAVAGTLVCAPVWRSWPRDLRDSVEQARGVRLGTTPAVLALLVAALVVPILMLPFFPPTAWDATMYHLPMPKAYVHWQRVQPTPFFRYPVFPLLNVMLFALGLLFSTDITAQLVEFLMLLLTALVLYALGRRLVSARAGLWAAAMWVGTPSVLSLGTSAMIDISVALYVVTACYALVRWRATGAGAWLATAGLLAGFAAGCKYTGLFFVGALGLAVLYVALRTRRWRDVFLFTAAAIAAGGPWYVYNAVTTGNPVFPFFAQLFGYSVWNADDLRSLGGRGKFGKGKSVLAFLALPWNLVTDRWAFNMTAPLSPFYSLLTPVLLAAGLALPRLRAPFALALSFTLVWFATTQEARYLMPVLPLLSLCAAAGLDWILSRYLPARARSLGLAVLVAAALVSPSWLYAGYRIARHGLPPAAATARDAYLARRLPSYPAFQLLNQRHGDRYRLYSLYGENMAYFADGTFMGDWFGPARYSTIVRALGDSRALYQALRHLRADYFLVSSDRVPVTLPEDAFFRGHFEPLYEQGSTRLFRLVE